MGLLSKFMGNGDSNLSRRSGMPNVNIESYSPHGNKYDFHDLVHGNFSGVNRLSEHEVAQAEETAQTLKQQESFYRRKSVAEDGAMTSARRIHGQEQQSLRHRLNEGLTMRGQAVNSKNFVETRVKPEIHRQNRSLQLASVQGQQTIALIDQSFEVKRKRLQSLRSGVA
ncbi:MAG: hypothetical protein ACRC8A_19910 [Microcoleaceae cyanobacterium]